MLTEQEVVAQLNERIGNGGVRPATQKFLDKIKTLQSRLEAHGAEVKALDLKKPVWSRRYSGLMAPF